MYTCVFIITNIISDLASCMFYTNVTISFCFYFISIPNLPCEGLSLKFPINDIPIIDRSVNRRSDN